MSKYSDKQVKGFEEKSSEGPKVITHDEYHDKKAKDCGCGINCCDNTIRLVDQVTKVKWVGYMSNGQLIWETEASYLSSGADAPTPPCTNVTNIEDNAIGIATGRQLVWAASTGATGYKITIGTTINGHEVCNALDLGSALSATPGTTVGIAELATATEYFVTISPYNASGSTAGCRTISFTTVTE